MTYREALTEAMNRLAEDPKRVFLGYGVRYGGMANGTLAEVPESQRIEMPVAENLMVGAAIGMAIEGYKPVVWIERADFLLLAMDALVNHLDKMAEISDGEFDPKVLIRVCVGAQYRPLYTGPTHNQDNSGALRKLVGFPVYTVHTTTEIQDAYAASANRTAAIYEYRDDYDS